LTEKAELASKAQIVETRLQHLQKVAIEFGAEATKLVS
jgi:hypothetical protein